MSRSRSTGQSLETKIVSHLAVLRSINCLSTHCQSLDFFIRRFSKILGLEGICGDKKKRRFTSARPEAKIAVRLDVKSLMNR